MPVQPLHHLAQTLTFRALSSPDPNSYLAGVEDGLTVANELLRTRLSASTDTERERTPTGSPLRALQALDLTLGDLVAQPTSPSTDEDEVIELDDAAAEAGFSHDIRTNWVAALAVGVAHDHAPRSEDVTDIVEEAGRDTGVLQTARERLVGLAALDEESRLRAVRLLDDALSVLDTREAVEH